MDEIANNISLDLQNERFNDNRDRLLYVDNPTKKDENTRSVFTLTARDTTVRPIVHPVEVIDVNEEYDHAYAIETETGVVGIVVVLIKNTLNKDGEVYANVYDLPFSTLSQIVSNCSSSPIGVKVKQNERVKLQVTIRPSATGEPTYKTHDTEVILSQVSEDEINRLKTILQFDSAKDVAHLISQIIDIEPIETITHQTRLYHQLFSVSLRAGWGQGFIYASVLAGGVTATATGILQAISAATNADENSAIERWKYFVAGAGGAAAGGLFVVGSILNRGSRRSRNTSPLNQNQIDSIQNTLNDLQEQLAQTP
jgi:hypothetical protein